MSTPHTPTITSAGLVVCDACAFRACLTTAGTMVTVKGDETIDHLAVVALEVRKRAQQVTPIMDRLRIAYNERRPLPERDDNMDDLVAAGVCEGRTLSLAQLQRLYRAVLGEFAV